MRRRAAIAALFTVMLGASAIVVACASFGGSSNEAQSDGSAPDQSAPLVDSGVADAFSTSGGPSVRSFSKVNVQTNNLDGGIAIARPANAQVGDLLVLVTSVFGNDSPASTPIIVPTDQHTFCPDLTYNHLQFGVAVDDGTPSYSFAYGFEEITSLDGLLIDIQNAGAIPDDFQIVDDEASSNGAAPSVNVFHAADLVLVGFAFQNGTTSTATFGAPEGGLTEITSTNTMILYQGIFPKGETPSFGPFSNVSPCWGGFTMAIAPH